MAPWKQYIHWSSTQVVRITVNQSSTGNAEIGMKDPKHVGWSIYMYGADLQSDSQNTCM